MKSLIVEDDFIARRILSKILSPFGECDIAIDGVEALDAFKLGLVEGTPYDLVCMDIMMPNLNGHEALKQIRALEEEFGYTGGKGVAVVMTSAQEDPHNVVEALYHGATIYLVKPVVKQQLLQELRDLGLID